MSNIKLLDCTLRDGGYINDWNFGHDNLVSVFSRLVDAEIDVIEIGFLDQRRPFDINRSIMPDTDCAQKIYGGIDRKNSMVVGMIDYGTCDVSNIKPRSQSFLDGIRVIFKKHLREQALEFCGELKKLGYKVFAQLVSVTSYSDSEMLDLIRLANIVKPYAVSMVDTYGLLHQNNLSHYFDLLDSRLDKSIGIGYHAHNNFQMGYANCITMMAKQTKREILVDGSMYGMGKSAGNAPLELLAMHMNHTYNKHYNIGQILEAIDANIMQFYKPATWGYNMFYYLAASNDCHPNYVAYLLEKRTLSVTSVNEILGRITAEKKLMYDKSCIEDLYVKYQNNEVNDDKDRAELQKALCGRRILLVGPGNGIFSQRENVEAFVREFDPIIISVNHLPEYLRADFVFLSNAKRYVQLSPKLTDRKCRVIATSNVTAVKDQAFDYVLNFSMLMDPTTEIIDNSLVMLLKELLLLGISEVSLAGFDGYSDADSNYYNMLMEYDFAKNKANYLNTYVSGFITNNAERLKVNFITATKYTLGGGSKESV